MNNQELIEKYENELKDIQLKFGASFKTKVYEDLIKDLKQLDEPQKVTIPQFVADYIESEKDSECGLLGSMKDVPYEDNAELRKWFYKGGNVEVFARAWLDGYEIEKEKPYEVILCNGQSLKTVYRQGNDRLDFEKVYGDLERFTRKQLEDAGLGWVFDCPGIEIREVEG